MDIEKVNLEPCNERVYDNVINSAMPSTILDIVRNFNVNKNITILVADENLNSTSLDGTSTQLNADTYQVTLNTGALGSASREYIAATIMHEMLHVYMGNGTSDHQTMATLYVEPMATTLKQLGYYISNESAQALAWGGLQKDANGNNTRAWNGLLAQDMVNGTTKAQDIININNSYRNGSVGRSCDGL